MIGTTWQQLVWKRDLLEMLPARNGDSNKSDETRKAAGPSKVCADMISASGEVGVSVMVELCQRVLHGKGVQDKGKLVCCYQFSKEREM